MSVDLQEAEDVTVTVLTKIGLFQAVATPSGTRHVTPGSSWFFRHTVLIWGGETAAFWCKRAEGARRRVWIRGRESLRVWAPWCETPTQPWGCTDSLFILGSLRPARAVLSLKDKNSCFVSCTDNKGPQIGRGLSLSNLPFSFFLTELRRVSKNIWANTWHTKEDESLEGSLPIPAVHTYLRFLHPAIAADF